MVIYAGRSQTCTSFSVVSSTDLLPLTFSFDWEKGIHSTAKHIPLDLGQQLVKCGVLLSNELNRPVQFQNCL